MRFNVTFLILGLTSFAAALPMDSNAPGTSELPVLIYTFTNAGQHQATQVQENAPKLVEEFLRIVGIQGKCAEGSEFRGDGNDQTPIHIALAVPGHKTVYEGLVKKTANSIDGMLINPETNSAMKVVKDGKPLPKDSVVDVDTFRTWIP
ncbi:hypothetical protein F5050DRAFT_1013552 [Lentinula boryana]|uniref:Uncharacterized protein n=1 Tax=Lentinula boryana TaxID=40481 RepID=A0ABQ8QLI6_9AGAR|nr:hypothetical protein F5050DRAFT_1013552 [Lentinula boryana]